MIVKKKTILFIVVVLLVSAVPGFLYLSRVSNYKRAVAGITYSDVELASIPDGTYTGECDVDFIRAKVEVVVANGKIEKVNLIEHYNDRGEAASGIGEDIVAQQRVDVDAVSGATNSSNVIKKAVDNALNNISQE